MSKWKKKELDETEKWLQANDPYYRDSNKFKFKSMDYPYLTHKQDKYRVTNEIPFSNLFKNKLHEINSKGNIDISVMYSDFDAS